jgi:hypothetical protein
LLAEVTSNVPLCVNDDFIDEKDHANLEMDNDNAFTTQHLNSEGGEQYQEVLRMTKIARSPPSSHIRRKDSAHIQRNIHTLNAKVREPHE